MQQYLGHRNGGVRKPPLAHSLERKKAQKFDLSRSDAEDFHRLPFT